MKYDTVYRTASGRILSINDGLSNGKTWGTYETKANGALRRIVSRRLPLRDNIKTAWEDFHWWVGDQVHLRCRKENEEYRPVYYHQLQQIQAWWPASRRSEIPADYRIEVER